MLLRPRANPKCARLACPRLMVPTQQLWVSELSAATGRSTYGTSRPALQVQLPEHLVTRCTLGQAVHIIGHACAGAGGGLKVRHIQKRKNGCRHGAPLHAAAAANCQDHQVAPGAVAAGMVCWCVVGHTGQMSRLFCSPTTRACYAQNAIAQCFTALDCCPVVYQCSGACKQPAACAAPRHLAAATRRLSTPDCSLAAGAAPSQHVGAPHYCTGLPHTPGPTPGCGIAAERCSSGHQQQQQLPAQAGEEQPTLTTPHTWCVPVG